MKHTFMDVSEAASSASGFTVAGNVDSESFRFARAAVGADASFG